MREREAREEKERVLATLTLMQTCHLTTLKKKLLKSGEKLSQDSLTTIKNKQKLVTNETALLCLPAHSSQWGRHCGGGGWHDWGCLRSMCDFMFHLSCERKEQKGHLKGLSPRWLRMCLSKLSRRLLALPQIGHRRSPVAGYCGRTQGRL